MSVAIFTIAQDETDSLRLWLAHYKKYAPTAQLYVLDHDSLGDAADLLRHVHTTAEAVVVPVKHTPSFDYDWLTRTVEDFQAFLLRSYPVVGFSEIDELVWPSPDSGHATLESFIAASNASFFRAAGWCPVHHHPEEPQLDWAQPLLAQRQHWYQSLRYSKICFARQRVYWRNGFHGAYNVPDTTAPDPALVCLHLHQIDFVAALRRHQKNAGRIWDANFRTSAQGIYQRLENPDDLARYLLATLDDPHVFAELAEIPEIYKQQYTVCLPR